MLSSLVFPIIRKYGKLIVSMVIMTGLAFTLMFGLLNGTSTLENTFHSYLSDYNYPDITIVLKDTVDKSELEALCDIKGVRDFETKFIAPVTATVNGNECYLMLFTRSSDALEHYFIHEMTSFDGEPVIAIDEKLAREDDIVSIKLGDTVSFTLDGQEVSFLVDTIFAMPETIVRPKDPTGRFQNEKGLGYAMISAKYLPSDKANAVQIYIEDKTESKGILDELKLRLENGGYRVFAFYDYETSALGLSEEMNIPPMKRMAAVLPVTFFAFMILVLVLILTQMIGQYRKRIGILRAMGFEQRDIRELYSKITFVISILGILLGLIGGHFIERYSSEAFIRFFRIPVTKRVVELPLTFISAAALIVIEQIASAFACKSSASVMPIEAMSSRMTETSSADVRLDRVRNINLKYSLTMLARNKRRFIFSSVCSAISVLVVFIAFCCYMSFRALPYKVYDDPFDYDVQLAFEDEVKADILDGYDFVTRAERVNITRDRVYLGDESYEIRVYAIEDNSRMFNIVDSRNNRLNPKEGGIILDQVTASRIGAKVGDHVTFKGHDLVVTDLSYQYAARIQYMGIETMNSICEPDSFNLFCQAGEGFDRMDFVGFEGSISAYFLADIFDTFDRTIDSFTFSFELTIMFACAMGFFVVYNTLQTNLHENRRQISMMRVLGFQVRDISNQHLIHLGLEFIIACLVGLPFGRQASRIILDVLEIETRFYPLVDKPVCYVVAASIVFAYMIFAHVVSMASIRKWNIAEETKEKE